MSSHLPTPPLTDAQLDAALASPADGLLPSSGFADAVMQAVHAQAAGPAPIPFPWKRALPGCIAIVGALLLVAIVFGGWLRRASFLPAHSAASSLPLPLSLELLLHNPAGSDALWVLFSLAIPAGCLLLMRRLLFSR
ncbi:MAG TPA: hypothetical protein VHX60_17400 [Acidobacteriaceae bacterium]|jgi:hypothetical protein|nr:hypothetical protein [Acidobacteriaceae bacterium]